MGDTSAIGDLLSQDATGQAIQPGGDLSLDNLMGGNTDTFSVNDNLSGMLSGGDLSSALAGFNVGGQNGITYGDNLGTSGLPIPITGGGAGKAISAIVKMVSQKLGQHVTAAQIASLLKRFGPAVAAALGLTATQTLAVVAKAKKRRSRGITARQLRNAVRVNHTVSKMYHQLHHGGGRRSYPRRSRKGKK